jgi:small subunit ribosomal protein S6
MTLPAPTYDLTLLLDSQAEEETRAKIVADARAAIDAQGELLRHDDWGERALTYPIQRKASAEYHLLQFHADTPDLLAELKRSLRITDGILRFRIIKLKPGVPEAPDMRAAPTAARRTEAEPRVEPEPEPESEPRVEPEPDGPAEAEAETAPAPATLEVGEPA